MDQNGSARAPQTGRVTRPGKKTRKHQIIRTTPGKRWSAQAERLFLEELAATANVRGAAAVAGFSTTALYNRRMRWPAFAEAWAQALEQGYARIETALIEMASDTAGLWSDEKERIAREMAAATVKAAGAAARQAAAGDRPEVEKGAAGGDAGGGDRVAGDGAGRDGVAGVRAGAGRAGALEAPGRRLIAGVDGGAVSRRPALSVAEMMNILKLHRASVRGGAAQDYGWRAGPPDMEAVRNSIRRKIEAIARMEARQRAMGIDPDAE